MTLLEFARSIPGVGNHSHADRIKCFAWFLHEEANKETFTVADIRLCFQQAHLELPANLSRSVHALTEKQPPDLLCQRGNYRLHARARESLHGQFGKPATVIIVEKSLASLPGKISNESERLFLEEALICYRHLAFRATIVITWNLAYDHLVRWIISDATRLNEFNQGIPKRNPKKGHITIRLREDFEELKEDEVVDIAGHLHGITGGMKKVLKEKLSRRNTYAHPSTLTISRPQVDDMVTDLVENIILRLQ